DFDDISKTNFNPFLLLITAPVYNIFSPFEVAERLQFAKAFHGDDTAFGRMAEEKFLNILGATSPPEKKSTNPDERRLWSPIDLHAMIEGKRYLLNNKPSLAARGLDNPDWYDYLVGKDFWEFVSGVEGVHKEIFAAIREAQRR